MAAEIAGAIQHEIERVFGKESLCRLPSSNVISRMARAHATGHAASGTRSVITEDPTLTFPVSVTYVDIGASQKHPVIFLSDYVNTLQSVNKLTNLTGHQPLSCLKRFWDHFRTLRPQHPVFDLPEHQRNYTVPMYLIGDEGRGYKKTAIMILGCEPVLGTGCEPEDEVTACEELKMNFRGDTYETRMLFSVLPRAVYKKNDACLHNLVHAWSENLGMCFREGLELGRGQPRLRIAILGLKADWPALDKLGKLERHFRREAYPFGKGICHLCQANTEVCPAWHGHDFTSAGWVRSMETSPLPWKPGAESALTMYIPVEPSMKPQFYLIDLFHTVHKGVHADLAGSAIVSWLVISSFNLQGAHT